MTLGDSVDNNSDNNVNNNHKSDNNNSTTTTAVAAAIKSSSGKFLLLNVFYIFVEETKMPRNKNSFSLQQNGQSSSFSKK